MLTPSGSLYDLRRQCELPSPHELKDFIKDVNTSRRPSFLERESKTCQYCSLSPKLNAYKNVIGAGFALVLVFSSFIALASLQSSLNDEQGLGLGSLVIANAVFLISGLFASSVIRILGTKYTLVLACCLSLVYTLTNFYPQWYTLIPGAICFGIAQAHIFASVNVHVTTIAIKYAPDLNERTDHLIALFTGMVTMFFKLAYIPGNSATTIILFSERHSSDNDVLDTSLGNVCNNTEVDTLNTTYVYILLSAYVVFAIFSVLISLFLMDHFGVELKKSSFCGALKCYVREPLVSTLKMFLNWKTFMIIPMMVTDGFITSVVLGKLSKEFVSDCIGVHWVGLFAMSYGVSSALAGLTIGRLVKWIPQFILVYLFATLLLSCSLFLLFWSREPSYIVTFVPTAIIGLCEGVWHTVPPTLIGILFPHKKEPAYSALRMGLASGYILGLVVAIIFETNICLWSMIGLVVFSLIAYSILIFLTQTKEQIFPCLKFCSKNSN